jgi:drug/metabolite transporter (DMT)-like permease
VTKREFLLFSALCLIWGIPYLLIKVAIADFSPIIVVFLRTAIAAALMIPLAAKRGDLMPALKAWRWVLVFAILEMVGPWWLLNDSETRVSSGFAGLMLATVPLTGIIVNFLMGDKTVFQSRRLIGMAIGFIGVVSLVGLDIHAGKVDTRSIIQLVLVAFGYSIAPAIAARKLQGVSIIGLVGLSAAMVAIIYAPTTILTWHQTNPTTKGILAVIVLGVVCTATAFLVMFELIKTIGPIRVTLVTYVNPAVAIILGIIFLSEKITAGTIIGFPLVLIGSYLASSKKKELAQ